jgi:hypothetical protein
VIAVTPEAERVATLERLLPRLRALLVAARLWARGEQLDARAVDAALDEALLELHRHYVSRIPVYRRLALDAGVGDTPDAATLSRELMVTSDLFKSYDPNWLGDGAFEALTGWLRTLFAHEPAVSLDRITDLAEWRERLRAGGVFVGVSSGTSGQPSFVPRDHATLAALRRNGAIYARSPFREPIATNADCLLLTGEGIARGIQAVAQGLAAGSQRVHRLEESNDGWSEAIAFLVRARDGGRPVLVFGTPPLVDALCARAEGELSRPVTPDGAVVTGGGWKGTRATSLPELTERVEQVLGVPQARVLDVYGATEINCYLLRCPYGSYHVPPLMRAIVLDDLLAPQSGDDVAGLLGFLDPFALSYPGFVIPGDVARLVRRACPCGLDGQALVGPIERSPELETRGCAAAPPAGTP